MGGVDRDDYHVLAWLPPVFLYGHDGADGHVIIVREERVHPDAARLEPPEYVLHDLVSLVLEEARAFRFNDAEIGIVADDFLEAYFAVDGRCRPDRAP